MSIIPESHADILERTTLAIVATIGPDGEPQNSPVWFSWDGEMLSISQTTGRQKYKNLTADPRIAIVIVDPDDPYRYLEVRGVVERIDDDSSNEFIDSLSKRYIQVDPYPGHQPGDHRKIMRVRPTHTTHMG